MLKNVLRPNVQLSTRVPMHVCKINRLIDRLSSYFFVRFFSQPTMAKSKFEYVKDFEQDDKLLPNCWIVVRIDGKGFHKFATAHNFERPNDVRCLNLMNRAAVGVMTEYYDMVLAYGQSDEYSFIFKKNMDLYNRRASKIASTVTSLFTSMFQFHWSKYFQIDLEYPPSFDGRCVLYPTDKNLIDYLSWRQADVHVNNLYNTTFWNLVQKSNMTPAEAEKHLRGTVSSDKNEILFSKFDINYNNIAPMYRKGTILLRKEVKNPRTGRYQKAIINIHEDMITEKFWKAHSEILENAGPKKYDELTEITDLVNTQFDKKSKKKPNQSIS